MVGAVINIFAIYGELISAVVLVLMLMSSSFLKMRDNQVVNVLGACFAVSILLVLVQVSSAQLNVGEFVVKAPMPQNAVDMDMSETFSLDKEASSLQASVFTFTLSANYKSLRRDLTAVGRTEMTSFDCVDPKECLEKVYPEYSIEMKSKILDLRILCAGDALSCLERIKHRKTDIISFMSSMTSRSISFAELEI